MLRAVEVIGQPKTPIELHSLEADSSGAVLRRSPKYPMTFGFTWRSSDFKGAIDQSDGQLTLELSLKLGDVPFTAQNPSQRRQWSSAMSNMTDEDCGGFKIDGGSSAVLSNRIDLPESGGFTADGFVINTSLAVLSLAPYLDLIAEMDGTA